LKTFYDSNNENESDDEESNIRLSKRSKADEITFQDSSSLTTVTIVSELNLDELDERPEKRSTLEESERESRRIPVLRKEFKSKPAKKKTKKFRYESKAARKLTQAKHKIKNRR